MANTPEGKVKDRIKAVLKSLRAYWHMPVQNGMGAPALDFHVCVPVIITPDMVGKTLGVYVGIEAKKPGAVATPRQLKTMQDIRDAYGHALLIDGNTCELESIAKWGFIHE